jgi:tetratricopeptide (TPR) repeat protein
MKTKTRTTRRLFIYCVLFFFISVQAGNAQISERGAGVSSSSSESPQNVYGLIVGVSEYKYVTPLSYATNDANLIANVIRSNFSESKVHLELLTNKLATELAIKSGLHKINQQVKSGDLVVFYFAGHGDVAYTEGSQRGYFLAHNASDSRDYEAGGAVRFDAVHDSIQAITNKGAKVYLITDACRAGKIIDSKGTSTTLAAFNTGYENTIKFISCQSSEVSYEIDELAHGVFTYFLAKGISGESDSGNKDEKISVREMDNYLTDSIEAYLSQLNKTQTPTVFGANKNGIIFSIDPAVSAYFSQQKNSQDLAQRAATSSDPTMAKFEQAIINKDLYGKSTSAQFILETAIRSKSVSANQIEEMKIQLADALMDRAQNNMNKFLSGKPLIDKNADFGISSKDLKIAAEILGKDHFMFSTLINRSSFFEALESMKSSDKNELSKAENILINLQVSEPKATYVQQGLAHLYIIKNDKMNAEKLLSETQRRIETWTKPYNTSAHLNILAGQLDKALDQLVKSEKLSSDVSDVFLLRSQMQMANFQLMEVQQELNKLEQSAPAAYSIEKAVLKGKMEELRGRLLYAENIYKEELKSDEINTTLLIKLADLYRSQNDTIRALEFYNKVVKLDPLNYAANSSIKLLTSKTPDSFTDFYNSDAVVNLLNSYDKAGKFEDGLNLINQVLTINNWSPEYYFQQGKFLYNLGRKTESTEALKKGIELSPYSYESIRALTLILIEQKKFTEADALIKKHDKYFSRSAKWLTFQYKAYRHMNSPNDLFVLLEKAIKMDSFDLEPHRELVALHVEYNGFVNAQNELNILLKIGGVERDRIQFLNRVDQQVRTVFKTKRYLGLSDGVDILLKESPFDLDYLFMGSMIAYMNKDYSKANIHLKEIQKFLQTLTPGAQLNYYLLKGKVYLETGHYQEAEAAFKMYNTKSSKPQYLGLSMAQFELNKKTEWPTNFNKDRDLSDFNDDALLRYEKMIKKAGK